MKFLTLTAFIMASLMPMFSSAVSVSSRSRLNTMQQLSAVGHWSWSTRAGKFNAWTKDATTGSDMMPEACATACEAEPKCLEAVYYTDKLGAHCYFYDYHCSQVDNIKCFDWKEPGLRTHHKHPAKKSTTPTTTPTHSVIAPTVAAHVVTPSTAVAANLHATIAAQPTTAIEAHPHVHKTHKPLAGTSPIKNIVLQPMPTMGPMPGQEVRVLPDVKTTSKVDPHATHATVAAVHAAVVATQAAATVAHPTTAVHPSTAKATPKATLGPIKDCSNGGITCGANQQCIPGYIDPITNRLPHYCVCASGFKNVHTLPETREKGKKCEPIPNPCLKNNGGCDEHATCEVSYPRPHFVAVETITCTCLANYAGDGKKCVPSTEPTKATPKPEQLKTVPIL